MANTDPFDIPFRVTHYTPAFKSETNIAYDMPNPPFKDRYGWFDMGNAWWNKELQDFGSFKCMSDWCDQREIFYDHPASRAPSGRTNWKTRWNPGDYYYNNNDADSLHGYHFLSNSFRSNGESEFGGNTVEKQGDYGKNLGIAMKQDPAKKVGFILGLPSKKTSFSVSEMDKCWSSSWGVFDGISFKWNTNGTKRVSIPDDPIDDSLGHLRPTKDLRCATGWHMFHLSLLMIKPGGGEVRYVPFVNMQNGSSTNRADDTPGGIVADEWKAHLYSNATSYWDWDEDKPADTIQQDFQNFAMHPQTKDAFGYESVTPNVQGSFSAYAHPRYREEIHKNGWITIGLMCHIYMYESVHDISIGVPNPGNPGGGILDNDFINYQRSVMNIFDFKLLNSKYPDHSLDSKYTPGRKNLIMVPPPHKFSQIKSRTEGTSIKIAYKENYS